MYSQLHMDYYRLSYPFLSVYASKLNYMSVWLLRSREQMSLAMVLAF